MSLFIAIRFRALVYDDDDDDAGLFSGAGTNFKVGGTYMSGAKRRKNCLSCPSTFLALQVQSVVLVSASVWSVQLITFLFFLFFLLLVPHAQSSVKWGNVPPCPGWSQRHFRVTVSHQKAL